MSLDEEIKVAANSPGAAPEIRQKYLERIQEGSLTRDEDPISHFCVYFLPYDTKKKQVFIIAHKKSGLWLSPGGHIDPGETPEQALEREVEEELGVNLPEARLKPLLLTITYIKKDVRPCKVHFDIWYFVPMNETGLSSEKEGEFDNGQWVSLGRARELMTDENNLKALDFVETRLFN